MEPNERLRLAYLAEPNEMAAREWMLHFAERGHEVTLIAHSDAAIDDGLDHRIRVVRMRGFGGRRIRPLGYLDARRAIGAVLAEVQPDVLHAHYLTGWGWLARISGFRPYAVTLWGSDVYRTLPSSRKARWFGRLALSGADVVTGDSQDLLETAVRAGARRDRVELIQFGVDLARFRPATVDPALRSRLGLDGRRVIFSPRQIAPLYDHVSVVRAAANLPQDVVVLMSARNAIPEYLREVEGVARDVGLDGRMLVVPGIAHDEMAGFYPLADVVVSVPYSDSTPVTILEAMACGRPVVATDLPSPREWLDEISPALLVPPGDHEALGNALDQALSMSPDELARRATRSREIVADRAERETNMSRMEALYRSVSNERRRT